MRNLLCPHICLPTYRGCCEEFRDENCSYDGPVNSKFDRSV